MAVAKTEEFDENLVLPEDFVIDFNTVNENCINLDEFEIIGSEHMASPPVLSPGQEETMDISLMYNQKPFIPSSPRGRPESLDFSGTLNFEVSVDSRDTHKNKYLYSHKLNKIYVDMNMNFPVQFNWVTVPGMFSPNIVRATCVFSDESQAEKRVQRCVQHVHESKSQIQSPEMMNNVLHSSSEVGTQGVYYCGEPSLPDSWYSVLVEFNKSGNEPCTHAYQFVCKNSCCSGINRRSIAIIFTLEDHSGKIYGRHTVGVRVCACLKRDMKRDEETDSQYNRGKRRITKLERATKKVKLEVVEKGPLITLPPLKVANEKILTTGLMVMLNMMEQSAAVAKDSQVAESYNSCAAAFRRFLDEMHPPT